MNVKNKNDDVIKNYERFACVRKLYIYFYYIFVYIYIYNILTYNKILIILMAWYDYIMIW